MLCYVPQWLWNIWEGGLINNLVMGMNHGLDDQEEISKKKGMLMDYLVSHIRVRNWRKIVPFHFIFRYFKSKLCEGIQLFGIFNKKLKIRTTMRYFSLFLYKMLNNRCLKKSFSVQCFCNIYRLILKENLHIFGIWVHRWYCGKFEFFVGRIFKKMWEFGKKIGLWKLNDFEIQCKNHWVTK